MQLQQSKYLYYTIQLIIFNLLLISFYSCKDKKDNGSENNLSASCIILTNSKLSKNWIPRYTKPTNPDDEKIKVIKLFSVENGKGGYDVTARAYNAKDNQIGKEIKLTEGIACEFDLPPLVKGKSNDLDLNDLKIINEDGSLIENFEKIILTPMVYKYGEFQFLQYQVQIEIGDRINEGRSSLPCPPCINCKPPCPDNCTPQCEPVDSVKKINGDFGVNPDSAASK